MARLARNTKGQTVLPEYVVTFFLVIGVVVAMSIYVQRGVQARISDARNYAVFSANADCDADCRAAAGLGNSGIPNEYEPYYGYVNALTSRSSNEVVTLQKAGQEGLFRKVINEEVSSVSTSRQLPPKDAAKDVH